MALLNGDKEVRARKAVAGKAAEDSGEFRAVEQLKAKLGEDWDGLSDEEKVLEVYKVLGGPVGEAPVVAKKGKKK